MVRIINYKKRLSEDGKVFFVLEITGGMELVKSKETGQFYVTSKIATIPSTFDENTCKALIGTELSGKISRQEVEPYTYVIKETGEELLLSHRWVYEPEEANTLNPLEGTLKADVNVFSENGKYAEVE